MTYNEPSPGPDNIAAPIGDVPPKLSPLPWQWQDIGKAILFVLISSTILMLVIMGIAMGMGTISDETFGLVATPIFVMGLGIYGIVIVAVYLFAIRRDLNDATRIGQSVAERWALLGWRTFEVKWIWLLLPLLFVQFAGMSIANLLFVAPFVDSDYENPQIEAITGGGALSNSDLFLLMILVAVVAPFAEELFFRGMLYPLLRQRWSMWPAIVINGLLFSLIHLLPPLLPGLFVVGMVLAWVRERSGSLIPCIMLHALQNGVVLWGIYQLANGAIP